MASATTKQYEAALKALGLTPVQTAVYLASLEHGILSPLELSRLTGVSRPQVYEAADKLVELGLYEITSKQRKKYIPARPEKLLGVGKQKMRALETQLADVETLLPALESLGSGRKRDVVTKHYEGKAKIKRAYMDELAAARNTEVLSFAGSLDDAFAFFPESFWDKWNREFATSHSRARMLVHDSAVARQFAVHDKEYRLETRHIPNFPLKVNIDVFNDIVLLVSYADELGIWIESRVVADSYRTLFESLWRSAQPFS